MEKNMIRLRSLNSDGIEKYKNMLQELRDNPSSEYPSSLLQDPRYSKEIEEEIYIEQRVFKNKKEICTYIAETIQLGRLTKFYFDTGLWSWLSLFYFDQVCSKKTDGTWKIREDYWYIAAHPKMTYRYYRHCFAYPCRAYIELGSSAEALLLGPINKNTELAELFGGSKEISYSTNIVRVATKLYLDIRNQKIKRGAGSRNPYSGGIRRFTKVINQLALTFDLETMSFEEIYDILPPEFNVWKR